MIDIIMPVLLCVELGLMTAATIAAIAIAFYDVFHD